MRRSVLLQHPAHFTEDVKRFDEVVDGDTADHDVDGVVGDFMQGGRGVEVFDEVGGEVGVAGEFCGVHAVAGYGSEFEVGGEVGYPASNH